MKAGFHDAGDDAFLDPRGALWAAIEAQDLDMLPAPVGLAAGLSPFMALSRDHGKVRRAEVRVAHNGRKLSVRLVWGEDDPVTAIGDLDRFVDGAAVMFPLTAQARALTMGDERNPVNAWLWKADRPAPDDVLAYGFGTSRRRGGSAAGLRAASSHAEGRWHVVFQRALRAGAEVDGQVAFKPAATVGLAVALWAGSKRERAGQKSVSGEWTPLEISA